MFKLKNTVSAAVMKQTEKTNKNTKRYTNTMFM